MRAWAQAFVVGTFSCEIYEADREFHPLVYGHSADVNGLAFHPLVPDWCARARVRVQLYTAVN